MKYSWFSEISILKEVSGLAALMLSCFSVLISHSVSSLRSSLESLSKCLVWVFGTNLCSVVPCLKNTLTITPRVQRAAKKLRAKQLQEVARLQDNCLGHR